MSSQMKPCVMIVGEIVSKTLHRRQGIQTILSRVNKHFASQFSLPLMLNDSMQIVGYLRTTENITKVLLSLKNEFHPLEIIYGVGIGDINEDHENSAKTCALEALTNVKDLKHKKEKALSDVMFKFVDGNESCELVINTLYKLVYIIERKWTAKQREVICTRIFKNLTQAELASKYNVSASNITQMLTNGQYFAYKESSESLEILLKDYFVGINELKRKDADEE